MNQLPNYDAHSFLTRFGLSMLFATGIFFFASLAFDIGLSGVIVETHPCFWILIAVTIYYAFKVHKEDYFTSTFLIYLVGLGLRLVPAFHTLYPGAGPWYELSSVNYIYSRGFNLKGNYYHSGMPVLQALILLTGPIVGYYSTLVFIIPILAWTLNYFVFFFFCRKHLRSENTLVALFLFAAANVFLQSTTRAEAMAVPFGMLIIHILLRKDFVSKSDMLLVVGLYALLIFTHHLTSFAVVLILAGITFAEMFFRHNVSRNHVIVFLSSTLMFFIYWEIYQCILSDKLSEIALAKSILPDPWPKPIWWWILYLLPKVFSAGLITYFVIHVLRAKIKSILTNRLMSICSIGAFANMLSLVMPGGYLFMRIFHQFFGYHVTGISNLPRSRIILKFLGVSFLFGLIADFPMIYPNSNYVIGGHWFDHSPYEVGGVEFLVTHVPNGSRIVIDDRVEALIYAFAPKGKVIAKKEPEVYRFATTEEAWKYSINRNYHYVFVSNFYKTMFIYNGGTAATKFSEEQLNRFLYPFFVEVYRNDEVIVYKVNRDL